jgi:hypothetical protein
MTIYFPHQKTLGKEEENVKGAKMCVANISPPLSVIKDQKAYLLVKLK